MFLMSTLLLLLLFLGTLYWYLKSSRNVQRQKLPGLEPELLFGNLRNTGVISGKVAFHEAFVHLKEKYGDVHSFWFGSTYSIAVSRLDYVQYVLANRHIYEITDRTLQSFGALFPNGLIALKGDNWKRHARFILPMLKRAKILPFFETIVHFTDSFVAEHFVKQDGKIHTDLIQKSQRLLLNVFVKIAFDYDLEASSKPRTYGLPEAFNDFVYFANKFILLSILPVWAGKLILRFSRKYQRALSIVRQYVMNVIDEEQSRQKEETQSDKPRNLITSLVTATNQEPSTKGAILSSNEIFDEVSLLTLGGFETTSTALSWFMFYMSKYPEVQNSIKKELAENNVTSQTMLTPEILDSLVYVECVVKEVLRFAPIAGALSRQATRDDHIDGIQIKKGDTVILAIQNIHRDPRYWKVDPTKFIPERFLDEDKNPPTNALGTFGGGHRACAGQDLAFFELKVIIARLMQRVTFLDPGDEADNSGGFVQRITCFPKHMAIRVFVDDGETL